MYMAVRRQVSSATRGPLVRLFHMFGNKAIGNIKLSAVFERQLGVFLGACADAGVVRNCAFICASLASLSSSFLPDV